MFAQINSIYVHLDYINKHLEKLRAINYFDNPNLDTVEIETVEIIDRLKYIARLLSLDIDQHYSKDLEEARTSPNVELKIDPLLGHLFDSMVPTRTDKFIYLKDKNEIKEVMVKLVTNVFIILGMLDIKVGVDVVRNLNEVTS